MTITEAAQQLGITRAMLSRVLNEHASITPEMALRLETWLGVDNGGAADVWLNNKAHTTYGKQDKNHYQTFRRCI